MDTKPIMTREEARRLLSDLKAAYLSLPANNRALVTSALTMQASAPESTPATA